MKCAAILLAISVLKYWYKSGDIFRELGNKQKQIYCSANGIVEHDRILIKAFNNDKRWRKT